MNVFIDLLETLRDTGTNNSSSARTNSSMRRYDYVSYRTECHWSMRSADVFIIVFVEIGLVSIAIVRVSNKSLAVERIY